MMTLRTPLSRVKGLGSAKEGVSHWWMQRLTAVALVPLTIWFCFSVASIGAADYERMRAWIAAPMVTVILVLLILTTFYHLYLGLQVIIEDYVQARMTKTGVIMAVGFGCILLSAIGVFAVLKIAIGA